MVSRYERLQGAEVIFVSFGNANRVLVTQLSAPCYIQRESPDKGTYPVYGRGPSLHSLLLLLGIQQLRKQLCNRLRSEFYTAAAGSVMQVRAGFQTPR